MKYFTIAATALALSAGASQSATTTSPIFGFAGPIARADCGQGIGEIRRINPSGSATCTIGAGSAEASVVGTDMRARAASGTDTPSAVSFAAASARLKDSVQINAVNPTLNGQSGTVKMSVDFDGFLKDADGFSEVGSLFSLAGRQYDENGEQGADFLATGLFTFNETTFLNNTTGTFSRTGNGAFANSVTGLSFVGLRTTVEFTFDVVFGEFLNYEFEMVAAAADDNSLADFFNTASITSVSAFDQQSQQVSASFFGSSGVGIDYVDLGATQVAPVPLPAGFPLLAAGLIGLGALARRKKSA